MTRQSLHDMPLAVREAFADACVRHGFVWEDFEVWAQPRMDKTHAPASVVTVLPVAGGDSRQYPADAAGVPWTVAFERDLERDVFGPPLAD